MGGMIPPQIIRGSNKMMAKCDRQPMAPYAKAFVDIGECILNREDMTAKPKALSDTQQSDQSFE